MRRRRFTAAFLSATILQGLNTRLPTVARIAAGRVRKTFAVDSAIDGIVIRGTWRARVVLGVPSLALEGTAAALRAVTVARDGTTLTIRSSAFASEPVPELRATVVRLRGVATSGSVRLTVADRSEKPLFLDLAGSGTAHATGAVPLLRVTTSGTVVADLSALKATNARVHARQKSELRLRALESLKLVAVDAAQVSYEGGRRLQITVRDTASVARF